MRSLAAALCLALLGTTAQAQSSTQLQVKNAAGSTVGLGAQQDVAGALHYQDVLGYVTAAGAFVPGLPSLPAPSYGPSGVAPVAGAFALNALAGSTSAAFTPVAGRPFNIAVWTSAAPGASLGATVYLVRSTDGGATFLSVTGAGIQLESFTLTASESWTESQAGVSYELVISGVPTASAINYRISQ